MLTRPASRKPVLLAAFAALAMSSLPAHAGEAASGDFARELDDPRKQEAMGNALGALMGALLNMKAAPLARAMERMGEHDAARRIPRDATLADLAGPEAKRMPGEVRRRVPMMMGAMSELAGMMQDLAPELKAIGKDFERQMDEGARAD